MARPLGGLPTPTPADMAMGAGRGAPGPSLASDMESAKV